MSEIERKAKEIIRRESNLKRRIANANMNIPILSRYFKRNHKQIVVLLGAGAAMPWGSVSSQDIKNKLKDDKSYKTSNGIPIGKFLSDILKEFYGNCEDCFNFETLLALIEEILDYIIASTNLNGNANNTSFIPAILQLKINEINSLFKDKTEVEKRQYAYKLFSHYIVDIVLKEIYSYNENILSEQYQEVNENLVKFTKYFLRKNYAVKFYTTNYDNIVPQVLSEHFRVYEGLHNSSDCQKEFNYDLSRFRKACVSHFNIHGSIFLHKKFLQEDNKYESVYNNKKCSTMSEWSTEEHSGNPGNFLPFTPIITGYKKTQRISNKPFNLGFHALANDCNDCKALLTVGFSFSDPHINSIISNFIKWDKTNLLDVNPSSELIAKDIFISQFIRGEKDQDWIHDRSGKKHIFKGGFDSFLNNKENWKYLIT
jgi:hypothetical protein